MDAVRSCYSSTWRFPETGDADVPGYYYFAPEDTPYYPDWHFFGSRNWHHNDGSPEPQYGEQANAVQRWRNGSFPVLPPDVVRVGSAECVNGDADPAVHEHNPTTIFGVDVRCWQREALPRWIDGTAGVHLEPSAGLAAGHVLEGTAGVKLEPTANLAAGHAIEGTAGVHLEPSADLVAGHAIAGDAGVHLEPTSTSSAGYVLEGTAGVHLEPTSTSSAGYVLEGTAGVHLEPTSTSSANFAEEGTAGVKITVNAAVLGKMTACASCAGGMFIQWRLTFAGGTGNNASFNGLWILRWTTGCTFALTSGANTFTLTKNAGPNTWTVTCVNATNTLVYTIAGASWTCLGANSLTFTSQVGTGTHPVAVGLTDAS